METIVLVHTGNFFPSHINDCIFQLKKYSLNIILIISSNLISHIEDKTIQIEASEKYEDNEIQKFSLKNHDNLFLDNFWTRTSSRFLILSNFSKINKLENFFHIENDVLIFSNLSKVSDSLRKTHFESSLVMDSNNRCVPSIMWFANYLSLEKIKDQILTNKHFNDMQNLAYFFHKNRKSVCNFPIFPDSLFESGINYSNMYDIFESIFDGAAIGQYFGGLDQRIHKNNTINFINETTIFNVSKLNYIWENSKPYALYREKKIPISNIHVHSKNLKKFINI